RESAREAPPIACKRPPDATMTACERRRASRCNIAFEQHLIGIRAMSRTMADVLCAASCDVWRTLEKLLLQASHARAQPHGRRANPLLGGRLGDVVGRGHAIDRDVHLAPTRIV